MSITSEINTAIARIHAEDHVVHSGLRDILFESVGPVFDQHYNSFPLRPSSCLKPLRDMFYDLKNFYKPGTVPREDFEPRIKLIFQFGHLTESLLMKLCAHKFDVLYPQERVKYGEVIEPDGKVRDLTGAIDWAMRLDGSSTALHLCDSKSIGEFPFKTAPKEDNIAQMQLYMHSDWGRKHNVNKAMLIYFNKNSSDLKCIEIDYDAGLAQKILDRMLLAYDYFKKDILPPREYLAGLDWRADYSPYRDYDNQEFTVPCENRERVQALEYFKPVTLKKDKPAELRGHVQKYGSRAVDYIDNVVFVTYNQGKLELRYITK